jgi:hypothetical protein
MVVGSEHGLDCSLEMWVRLPLSTFRKNGGELLSNLLRSS